MNAAQKAEMEILADRLSRAIDAAVGADVAWGCRYCEEDIRLAYDVLDLLEAALAA